MRLPKIYLGTEAKAKGDVLVFPFFQGEAKKGKGEEKLPDFTAPVLRGKKSKDAEGVEKYLAISKHFMGKKQETSLLRAYSLGGFPNTALLGLGTDAKWGTEMARQAGAALFLFQKREKLARAVVHADQIFTGKEAEAIKLFRAFAEGYFLASYDYAEFKKPEPSFFPDGVEILDFKSTQAAKTLEVVEKIAQAIFLTRSLGDKPGNALTPKEFTKVAQGLQKEFKLGLRVLGRKEMEKAGMGLFVGVAKGSHEEPQLIVMEYHGGKKSDRPIAIIGKGVTFDSGGISLKPADRMEEMKYDMMGAATVFGIMRAVAALKLPVNVYGYVGATENMPGGAAQKPGDVQKSMSGKTVEIVNTDAEGRLVLADVIEYAQKDNPQAIIDFATLTGAVVVALGSVTTGIMGTHPGLVDAMKASAVATDERVWELPLYEEYEDDLKSHYADIRNSGTREAGSSKGGTFLKFFVDPKTPWVHCDIAGSAYHRKDRNYYQSKFGAGVMIRLMTHLLEHWKPLK